MEINKKGILVYLRGDRKHSNKIIMYLKNLGGICNSDMMIHGIDPNRFYYINCNGYVESSDRISNWMRTHYIEIYFGNKYKPKDKELVWCWGCHFITTRHLKFYDAKYKGTFDSDGMRKGFPYDNYEPFKGEYPDWAKKALTILED